MYCTALYSNIWYKNVLSRSLMTCHDMSCLEWNGMEWNGTEWWNGLYTCVCMCTHVRRYYKKVLMLAHDEYMWQQTYSLRFYAQGEKQGNWQYWMKWVLLPFESCGNTMSTLKHLLLLVFQDELLSSLLELIDRIAHHHLVNWAATQAHCSWPSCSFSAIRKLWRKLCRMDSTRLGLQNGMLSKVLVSAWGLWQVYIVNWRKGNIAVFVSAGKTETPSFCFSEFPLPGSAAFKPLEHH